MRHLMQDRDDGVNESGDDDETQQANPLSAESRNDHRFIVTVPGRGYRFVADVKLLTGFPVQPAKSGADLGRKPRC